MRKFLPCLLLLALAPIATAAVSSNDPLRAPDSRAVEEARAILTKMAANSRGPYLRIRWFCNDGSVLPPEPYACRPHGGGRQHAEYSPDRQRLAALGYHVGTIFAALNWDEFFDSKNNYARLGELVLERYLTEVADGWVMRLARDYRGRVQAEDEDAAGRRLLLRLLADRDWVEQHYLLARETAKVVPHSGNDDLTRVIRRRAQDLAEADSRFEKLRIEVHTTPTRETADRIRIWAKQLGDRSNTSESSARQANLLADNLDDLYGPTGRARRLREARALLARHTATGEISAQLEMSADLLPSSRVERIARAMQLIRQTVIGQAQAEFRLQMLDLLSDLETELRLDVEAALRKDSHSRASLLALSEALVQAAFGAGYLSPGESMNTVAVIAQLRDSPEISVDQYLEVSRTLNRAVSWPVASVRYVFALPLQKYIALDSRSAGLVDDLLRSSSVYSLAKVTRIIAHDAQSAAGIFRSLAGKPAPALMALNPGLARGKLRVLSDAELAAGVQPARDEIVLVPQTIAELSPVAGILTGGEGNLLSHLQLLARNLGIPNVSVSAALLSDVAAFAGQEVVLAVDSAGSVVLQPVEKISQATIAAISDDRQTIEPGSLEVPEPSLEYSDPIPLKQLKRSLSGRVVGPKAANLGELARLFPGRVAPAVALPFGMFFEHMTLGEPSPRDRLLRAYRAARLGQIREPELQALLAGIRDDISKLELTVKAREKVLESVKREFGDDADYGIFIRSDTNVEDLPGFSGAGLNETLNNVVGRDQQLAGVPRVWSSVLSPRSIAWRANLMKNPERIYASVLLMKSVPANKSGVLVTTDLVSYGPGITVSTAWGVAGAVAGEAAETLLLLPDGRERLISENKTPYSRKLAAGGGIEWHPATAGPVLSGDEKRQLRELVAEVNRKYKPVLDSDGREMPWDIEFGFVSGQLTLFQIRPLVEKGYRRAARVTRLLGASGPSRQNDVIRLEVQVQKP